jgi:hypothetical protein
VGGCIFEVEAIFSLYSRVAALEAFTDKTFFDQPSLIQDLRSTTHRQTLHKIVTNIAHHKTSSLLISWDLSRSAQTTRFTACYENTMNEIIYGCKTT